MNFLILKSKELGYNAVLVWEKDVATVLVNSANLNGCGGWVASFKNYGDLLCGCCVVTPRNHREDRMLLPEVFAYCKQFGIKTFVLGNPKDLIRRLERNTDRYDGSEKLLATLTTIEFRAAGSQQWFLGDVKADYCSLEFNIDGHLDPYHDPELNAEMLKSYGWKEVQAS